MRRNDNPFAVLGASPRDSRKRLQELRDNAKLLSVQNAADSAYAALIKPEERLAAELRWVDEHDSRPIAPLNRALGELERQPQTQTAAEWVLQICKCFGAVDEEKMLEAINADRETGKWKCVQADELQDALMAYRGEIAAVLDGLFTGDGRADGLGCKNDGKKQLVIYADTLLELIGCYARGMECFAGNALVEELAGRYELSTSASVDRLHKQVMDVVSQRGDPNRRNWSTLTIENVCRDVRDWDALTQPVRKLRLARGMRNFESEVFGDEIRLFMAEMFNCFHSYADSNMLIEVLRTCFWDCEALQKQLEKDQQIVSEQMQRLEEQRQEQVRENHRRMLGSLLGVILCVITVAILNSNSGDNDRSSKRPVYTFRPPVAQKYDDPAIRMAMELLKDQDRDQNLTPLEKKQKEIEAKQEELRKATASGANHAKLLQLTYELQTLRAEYEALEMAEEEKDESSKKTRSQDRAF